MQPVTSECDRASVRAARLSVFASASLVAVQLTIGWCADSRAIFADGVHTFIDLLVDALLFASLLLRASQLRKLPRMAASFTPATFCTTVSALAGAALLAQGCGGMSVADATIPAATSGATQSWVLAAALLVIAIREYTARRLSATAEKVADTDSRAASVLSAGAWHARIDALSACAAAAGAGGILAGFGNLDHIATALIGAIMLATAIFPKDSPIRKALGFLKASAWRMCSLRMGPRAQASERGAGR
ncbi:cation transporter [Paraburkholderia sp. Ac-20340]|uniref:cation transporter n=1 Tax=Paraburkholderia sp. Ac-20340 TaxID=2703888 RepID=UPI002402AD90|nr:cation transporter [Paraburkholderia sp. Ac-20340]